MFDLILDSISPIDESELVSITGSIVGLDVPGGEVSLSIDFGDLSAPTPVTSVSVRDDGSGSDQTAGDGVIQFAIETQYQDDDPSGTPADTYRISVDAREQVLAGTDAVFVIDRSGSTAGSSLIDVDGDGLNESILEAEVAAFKLLNQDLIDRGLGDVSKVSVAAYSSVGSLLDLDPSQDGIQTFTTPNADADNNGVRDVDQALDTLFSGGGTSFTAGLQQAIAAVNAAGTNPGQGSVIFLSDGFGSGGETESAQLTGPLGQSLRAFGVGSGSSLTQLQRLDPNAEQFTDIQELLDLFGGVGSNVNQASANRNIRINNIETILTVANPGNVTEDSEFTLTGLFTDPGSLDTFDLEVDWDDGDVATFDVDAISTLSAGDTFTSSSDGSVLTITSVNTNTGRVDFSIDHTYNDDGVANIELTIADDDSGSQSQTVQVTVQPDGGSNINQDPNAVNDAVTTDEDTSLSIPVSTLLTNDSDPDGDSLTITAVDDSGTTGSVSLNGNRVVYNPNGQFESLDAGETARDRFTYTVSDGTTTDTATVVVTINGVDDNPTTPANRAPNAVADTATTDEDTPLSIPVSRLLTNDSDPDGDPLTITAVNDNGTRGTVSLNGNRIVYDPNGQFESLDDGETATARFTYTVSDGSRTASAPVTINITGVTDSDGGDGDGDGKKGQSIFGTRKADKLVGTHDGETIRGRNGSDMISGRNGDDCLIGGRGNDTLSGGRGNDTINGGAGQDQVHGGLGDDVIRGGKGNDLLDGGSGDDTLNGGAAKDMLLGKSGDDQLFGGKGSDTLDGGGGDDLINGGRGQDVISGGKGKDTLRGGKGQDQFILAAGEGRDTIVDFNAHQDLLVLSGGLTFGALSFSGNQIIDTASSSVVAELLGVDTTTLSAAQFQTV